MGCRETNTMTQQIRYSRWMQLRREGDSLADERENWISILKNLNTPHLTFASHKKTGIVYDLDVIKTKLKAIESRLEEVHEELN